MKLTSCAFALAIGSLAFPFMTHAGPGHDHGDEAPVSVGKPSPRFVMASDLFEAVGIVKGNTLEIYVDHAASNAPVENATVELELNGTKLPLELHALGEFDAVLPEAIAHTHDESPLSVAMTITTGEQVDMLTGELFIAHTDEHASGEESHSHWAEFAMYGSVGLMVLALAALGMQWNKKRKLEKGMK